MAMAPLGQLLMDMGALTQEQLDHALRIQSATPNKKLGEILLDMNMVSQSDFMRAYAQRLNVQFVELNRFDIDEAASRLIPEKMCVDKNVLGIKIRGNVLTVATDNPVDFYQLDDIKILTGYEVTPVLATTSDIKDAIHNCFAEEATKDVLNTLNTDYEDAQDISDLDTEIASLGEKIDSAPVVKMVNTILYDSYRKGASDIHIEPSKKKTKVRIRIDGELIEQVQISSAAHNAIITRLKILSDMNIAEKRVPQDGRFSVTLDNNTIDLRVSTLPTVDGEKMVIRLLGSSVQQVTKLSQLGMSEKDFTIFKEMLKNPNGVIMVTGPTGSGKSTTLYAALDEVSNPAINIVTVEDPVEKNMENINQVQINVKAGLTFAEGLRSILRQDPDVIMIGEIRDGETASIAVRSAITGHLVLSTIHTNDAVSTISRLVDMGIEPYLVASSLVGVVAQRLIKKLCPECAREVDATPKEMELLGVNYPVKIKEACGCDACGGSGYKGRTAIYEMIQIDKKLKNMISSGDSEEMIRDVAKQNGATFLRESAAKLVLEGKTDMRQLLKLTYGMDE